MKKIISAVLILTIFTWAVFGVTKPVFAEVDGVAVGVAVGLGLVVAVIAGVIAANNSAQEKNKQQQLSYKDELKIKFDARLGSWSFDDMLMELGKPTEVTEGDAIKMVVYDKRKTGIVSDTEYEKGNFLANATSKSKSTSVSSGEVMTFTFDKKTKKLIKWLYENYREEQPTESVSGTK